jgi:hypothetical protein
LYEAAENALYFPDKRTLIDKVASTLNRYRAALEGGDDE